MTEIVNARLQNFQTPTSAARILFENSLVGNLHLILTKLLRWNSAKNNIRSQEISEFKQFEKEITNLRLFANYIS